MKDNAAYGRVGLGTKPARISRVDPRVRVDLDHLRSLEGRARALRFLPRQPARSVLNGRHASRLRGRGLNFEELCDYLPGDDTRTIDWKVTARTGKPHVRVYTEERDKPSLIVVDQRLTMFFGSKLNMKSVTAAETAALIAFRIADQGDRVGGIVFGDDHIAEFRPKRSRRALDRLLSAVAHANQSLSADMPSGEGLPLNRPLSSITRIARRNHLIIIISDFAGIDEQTRKHLSTLARHNDLVLCVVSDPIATDLPDNIRLTISDGSLQAQIDTGTTSVRTALADMSRGRLAEILNWQNEIGMPVLPLSAGEETLPQIRSLMGLGRARH
ncbi:MAG: DUF58 domain-containing protein [Stappiaceae bacterium]